MTARTAEPIAPPEAPVRDVVRVLSRQDESLVEALRDGDEEGFRTLVATHQSGLLRLALGFVRNPSTAEEVVQDTWVAVLEGIRRFEGRSALRTWISRICANIARTRAGREARTKPLSALGRGDDEGGPVVDPERFFGALHPLAGHWLRAPSRWDRPEERLLGAETLDAIQRAMEALPPAQQQVLTLRDVEGWDSVEVCRVLEISEVNQRVLLHRARSKVRAALENHLGDA